jgi:hypothetical protein
MANNITGNPHIIDTPGSGSALAWSGNVLCHHIEFSEYTPATTPTSVTVYDKAGREVATLAGVGSDATVAEEVRTGQIGWIHDGYYVIWNGAQNGKVKVYIK